MEKFNSASIINDGGSFRDPCGQVYKFTHENGVKIIRGVNEETFHQQSELINEDFFQSLIEDKKIIETTVFDKETIKKYDCSKKWPFFLRHKHIDLITYPYEWTFSQLKDAAILHLELLKILLEKGWILKDSTPYNIQFEDNIPVFIDTPSIIKWEKGSGWDSYRQFCMMFLYPLMLEAYKGIDFRQLLKSNLDGIEPEFIYKVTNVRDFFKKGVISHIYLPYLVQRSILKKERDTAEAKVRSKINHSEISVIALVDSMLNLVRKLKSKSDITAWADYDHINTYLEKDNKIKQDFIVSTVRNKKFQTVWDCGANTGLFSETISEFVGNIVAFDADPVAVEKMYLRLKANKKNIFPLVMQLQNMSPKHGFNSSERVRLEDRSSPNLIMCLALIHHIRIGSNIPCEIFLKYLSTLNSNVIIEFVNREDEMVKKLLTNKKEQYDDYNIESFKKSAQEFFTIKNSVEVKDGLRILFYLEPK